MQKFGKIHDEEKDVIRDIFTDIQDDPDWHEESTIYDHYNKRIPVKEIFSLLSSDKQWSYMANKQQTEKVYELFDKIYGYDKGLSRLEEQ